MFTSYLKIQKNSFVKLFIDLSVLFKAWRTYIKVLTASSCKKFLFRKIINGKKVLDEF